MTVLERADRTRLHRWVAGDGPPVVISPVYSTYPEQLDPLADELARDHLVVRYDLRGTGRSSRTGPYDMRTDVDDLLAVAEAAGGDAVAVGLGDGSNRAVRAAAERPDLIGAVVLSGNPALGRAHARGTDALAGSASVLQGIVTLFQNDYRAGIRSVMESADTGLEEDEIRERVDRSAAHVPQAAAVGRLRAWIDDDPSAEAAVLAGRLWILSHAGNPWFPASMGERMKELLPEAHVEEVEDGAISRPDITARVVRGVTVRAGG